MVWAGVHSSGKTYRIFLDRNAKMKPKDYQKHVLDPAKEWANCLIPGSFNKTGHQLMDQNQVWNFLKRIFLTVGGGGRYFAL